MLVARKASFVRIHAVRPLAFGIVFVFVAAGAAGCKGTSSTSAAGVPSSAVVRWADGGGGAELVNDGVSVALPEGELANGAAPAIVRDEAGKRLSYPTASGKARVVYVVGGAPFVGPLANAPIDFRSAPELDGALGALFENATQEGKRSKLVELVTKEKGEAGLVRMLADGAAASGKEWEEAFANLPPPRATEVKTALATRLEKGKPTAGLARAVAIVPLREPARAPALAARIRELAEAFREPRATAVMLRALAVLDKTEAAKVGCEIALRGPTDPANLKGPPEEIDRQGRDALLEAAILAVANAGAACPKVEAALADDPCATWLRCGPEGPIGPSQTSTQTEPLCSKEQIEKAIAQELERPPAEVVAVAKGVRTELFAYAVLLHADKVPPKLVTAHARRRYDVAQPKTPECDYSVAIGAPCHCDEATLRDQTCRHPESAQVSVGLCKFDVDDKAKKITNVVMTPPP